MLSVYLGGLSFTQKRIAYSNSSRCAFFPGNFILQFLATSILFGIPIFLLFVCIGTYIRQNSFSLRQISPICNGIGISALIVQILVTIYSSIIVVWTISHFSDAHVNSEDISRHPNNTAAVSKFPRKVAAKGQAATTNDEQIVSFQVNNIGLQITFASDLYK